jgi:hypothetical protein
MIWSSTSNSYNTHSFVPVIFAGHLSSLHYYEVSIYCQRDNDTDAIRNQRLLWNLRYYSTEVFYWCDFVVVAMGLAFFRVTQYIVVNAPSRIVPSGSSGKRVGSSSSHDKRRQQVGITKVEYWRPAARVARRAARTAVLISPSRAKNYDILRSWHG